MSILDRFRLDGKRLFITGGSRGLGRAMALAIADAGADVVLTGRDADSLERTAADIRGLGRQAWTVQADVSQAGPCEEACRTALAHGPIDILINNVGGRRENIATQDMPLETWRALMDLNLTSAVLCTKLIGGAMLRTARADASSTSRRSAALSSAATLPAAITRLRKRHSCNSRAAVPPTGHGTASQSTPSCPAAS